MITLNWHEVSDFRSEARHGDWLLVIRKVPNWDKHPQCNFDHVATAHVDRPLRGEPDTLTNLGTFPDSTKARAKCAEFINSKQTGDSRG